MSLERSPAELNDHHLRSIEVTDALAIAVRDLGPILTGVAGAAPSGGLERATRDARMALREAASAAAEAAGHARLVADVLDEALAVLAAVGSTPAPPRPAVPSPGTDRLSAREREVLALVAEGRSNKAIAEALFVSPNTVKTHVASLLRKLHADNRAQLAAIATKNGVRQPRRGHFHHGPVS